MDDPLRQAREFAETLRFSSDTLRPDTTNFLSGFDEALQHSYVNALRISPEVTPRLSQSIDRVCERLLIPSNALSAFVYPSPEIQASCHSDSSSRCIVKFSSTLIDRLDSREFEFVASHEIGHFLLQHHSSRQSIPTGTLEYYMKIRYQEISVDRVGLFGCGSVKIAVSAMMKTLSGLSGRHLRKDVAALLRQLTNVDTYQASSMASHPSILVRCRALLWFSMACQMTHEEVREAASEISRIDEKVLGDMNRFVDAQAKRIIAEARTDLDIWNAALKIVQGGSFSKEKQQIISDQFGTDILEKLRGFLSGLPAGDAENIVSERVQRARRNLEQLSPASFHDTIQNNQ